MPRRIDPVALGRQLIDTLAEIGPAGAPEVCRRLGISQPTLSRLVARAPADLLVLGRGRATRYAARREIPGVGTPVPIFRIDAGGRSQRLGRLHAVRRSGYVVEAECEAISSGPSDGLPFFLIDLKPAGFLGRLVPPRHPELALPADVRLWTAEHSLRYLTRHEWNGPGDLIIGDEAFSLFLTHATAPPDRITAARRRQRYAELAEDALAGGVPGSSAAGEQPKFLATRVPGGAVLVKFSPPAGDAQSARLADLLVCEHLAHRVMARHGLPACRSTVLCAADRTFLEVQRFDRVGAVGRRGVLSLAALDLEYVGDLRRWVLTAEALGRLRLVAPETIRQIRWLEVFGGLIANGDMHPGNLSFFADGARPLALAPAYDMLPSLYAPRDGQLVDPDFRPPLPRALDAPVWDDARIAAIELWQAVAGHALVSAELRAHARANAEKLAGMATLAALLPVATTE